MKTYQRLLAAIAVVCFAFSTLIKLDVTHAQAPVEKPNAVLILDSSRSMWGQIDGQNKVVIARTVISDAVRKTEGKANLGLVSYGHRQSTGCTDIEVLLNPADRKADEVIKTISAIKPKGSTPLAESLIIAARSARYKDKPANIILLADGLDNCDADPCEVAEALENNGKDLTIHAIGFDARKSEELKKLSCIGSATGGSFAIARNESELVESMDAAFAAVIKPVMPKFEAVAEPETQQSDPLTTSSVKASPATATTLAQAQKPEPAPPITMQAPANSAAQTGDRSVPVTLSARTVEGGAIIKSGLVWWIYKNDNPKDGKYQLIETFREGTPTVNLAPGAYRIAAAYGKVHLIKDIEVSSGRAVQEIFVLNAGGLRLNAVTQSGTVIPPNSVSYDILSDESESDQYGNRKVILRDAKPGVVLRLNAGAYQVVSTYGDANAIVRADVTVEPGRLTDATINHTAAKVTFKLVTQPGGEALADTQWNILTPSGDTVKESAGALPTHILAAGNYKVVAQYQGKKYTRDFYTEPGDVKQIEVVIQ